MAFPVLGSKLVRALSIIPKLCLRPSADLSGHLTWSGQANLLTAQHSTLLVQAALRPAEKAGCCFKGTPKRAHRDHFPGALDTGARRIPSKATSCRVVNRPTRMAGRTEALGIS